MRDPATYEMPADGWVCFHCGERFKQFGAAEDHFGKRPSATLACRMQQDLIQALMELRKAEAAKQVVR